MRLMSIEDYDQVYSLWLQTEGMDLNAIDESREGIEKYLKRNPQTCFVEERNGKIVGAILASHDGRRGTLHHLAVQDKYRGQGIGKALALKAIEALQKEGIIRAALFVYCSNYHGMNFWNSLGFKVERDYLYLDKDLIEIPGIRNG